jgi:hypothetical protein
MPYIILNPTQELKTQTTFQIAKILYQKYGRGVLIYTIGYKSFFYALPTSSDLSPSDVELLQKYDPSNEFVLLLEQNSSDTSVICKRLNPLSKLPVIATAKAIMA